MNSLNRILSTLPYIAVALASFFLFSSPFYPLFNTDDGVTVLMTEYWRFPDDIYFWQQNRIGSLTPMIGQLFKPLGFSSMWIEALVHFAILLFGAGCYLKFIPKNSHKLMFFAAWFLPPIVFIGIERYAFGLQYALFGMVLCLVLKTKLLDPKWSVAKLPMYAALVMILVLAQWACDAGLISFLALVAATMAVNSANRSRKTIVLQSAALLSALAVSKIIITWMKSLVEITHELPYSTGFISVSDFFENLHCLYEKFTWSLSTSAISPLYSFYVILALIGVFVMAPGLVKKFKALNSIAKILVLFCALDALLLFAAILVNQWSHQSELPRRYFCGIYISLWFLSLVFLSQSPSRKLSKSSYFIIGLLLLGAVITPLSYQFHEPKTLTSKTELVKEFEQFGPIGIIGNYWNSYDIAAFNPALIKATPHDLDVYRSEAMIQMVFKQPRIFLIKDMWLTDFPEQINQFSYPLEKIGGNIPLSNWNICEYKISTDPIQVQNSQLFFNGSMTSPNIYSTPISEEAPLVFGPYLDLHPGRYSLRTLASQVFPNTQNSASMDLEISAESGQKSLAYFTDINLQDLSQLEHEFYIDQNSSKVEFRLFVHGIDSLKFNGFELSFLGMQ